MYLGKLCRFCRLRWWVHSRYPQETRPECRTNTSSEKAYYDKLRIAKRVLDFWTWNPMKDFKLVNENQMGILKRSFQCECEGQQDPLSRGVVLSAISWVLRPRPPDYDSIFSNDSFSWFLVLLYFHHRLWPALPSVVKICPAALHGNSHSSPGIDKSSAYQ